MDRDDRHKEVTMAKPRIEAFGKTPPGVSVYRTFSKFRAVCEGALDQEHTVPAGAWIDLGIEWYASDLQRAVANWQDLDISITVDNQEIEDPKRFSVGPYRIKLECPDGAYEGYAMGVEIFIPPLPVGDHRIVWQKRARRELNDGWGIYPAGRVITLSSLLHVVEE